MNDDLLFKALADRTRREILDRLRAHPGATVGGLAEAFASRMSRVAIIKHLRVLERGGLVASVKRGKERLLYVNAVPLLAIVERWTSEYGALWAQGLLELKARVEQGARNR